MRGHCLLPQVERACYEDLAFRVLTANQQPDHSRISEFRRQNHEAFSELFVQILLLCQKAGMVSLGKMALDGTKGSQGKFGWPELAVLLGWRLNIPPSGSSNIKMQRAGRII